MPYFLELVAKDILSRFGDNAGNLTLVFPSQRAGLFFNRYLAKQISKPTWSPSVVTINELMQSVAGLTIDDPFFLVTKLYSIYNKVRGLDESFDNFYFWGEVMLSDFDQIDKYLVDVKKLFGNIQDIKEIEERFGGLSNEQIQALKDYLGAMTSDQVSELREKHLSIWANLYTIYQQYNQELDSHNVAYEGKVYRKAANILSDSESSPILPKPIAFIGFNALNECEKKLLLRCKRNGDALFYWDYDAVFLENPNHEAGLFIRQNLSIFPNALTSKDLSSNPLQQKKIRFIAAPSTVAQSKLVPRILDEICGIGAKLDISTAIIFPKENILIPTLQAIPNENQEINITMGYPIKETPAYSLVEFLVKLQSNADISKGNICRFYHRDTLAILNHPYIRLCEPETSLSIISDIKRKNRIYPQAEEIAATNFLKRIFTFQQHHQPITSYILSICKIIAKTLADKLNEDENQHLRIDLEFLYALHKSLTRLEGVLKNQTFNLSHKLFLQLLRKAFAQERVSFSGEPLAGLQMMGFLETRALDFENIVILSFNDDVLPGRNHPVSFITPSLRIAFGLPDYKHHDAVYAYYFYRLLNRAKNVYLVYSARAEGLSSGEKSRFGLQLEMEQMIGQVETIPVGYNLMLAPTLPITINKSPSVIKQLQDNLSKRGRGITLSPSGLTTYLTCSLRFYFRYVLRIDEQEDIAEEVGALEFGKVIHSTMEELYKPFTGQRVTPELLKALKKDSKKIESILDLVFCNVFLKDENAKLDSLTGRNMLARNAMLYSVKKMIDFDTRRAPFTLISHEEEVYTYLDLSEDFAVRLGGFVDRIEENDGTIWAIDYKTGKHDRYKGKFESIEELFDPANVDKRKEVLQTFCYSLALRHIYPNKPIKPNLWFVKAAKEASDIDLKKVEGRKSTPVLDFQDYEQEFLLGLNVLLKEIFNPEIPFTQTTDSNKCKTCPFAGICGKD